MEKKEQPKPMLEVVIEALEKRGFRRIETEDGVTFWTCDEWKNWWLKADGTTYDRKDLLKEVIASVIGEESGYEALTHHPKTHT